MNPASPNMLALQRLYHWKKTAPHHITLTQPMGGGVTQDYTWSQARTLPSCPKTVPDGS